MRLAISNAISFNLFPQNINPNSTVFHPNYIFSAKSKDGRVRIYILEEKVETDDLWNGELHK